MRIKNEQGANQVQEAERVKSEEGVVKEEASKLTSDELLAARLLAH